MEPWQKVFREGFAPFLPTRGLMALRDALKNDDKRLIQGGTTEPPPLRCVQDWPCQGACLIGFVGWQGKEYSTVAEVEEFFSLACFYCDEQLNESSACRHLLNFFDETPRAEMIAALLPEVEAILAERGYPCLPSTAAPTH